VNEKYLLQKSFKRIKGSFSRTMKNTSISLSNKLNFNYAKVVTKIIPRG